jgi:hypothetical protein
VCTVFELQVGEALLEALAAKIRSMERVPQLYSSHKHTYTHRET